MAIAILLIAPWSAHAVALSKDEVVQMVRERIAANYAPVKTLQAALTSTSEDRDIKKVQQVGPNEDGVGLSIKRAPRSEIKWTATIAGTDERYEIQYAPKFSKTLLRRGDVELEYATDTYAYLYLYKPEQLKEMQYDPRSAMFWSRTDTIESVLSGKVESAEIVEQDGETVALITAAGTNEALYQMECPESTGYLPTQVYKINDYAHPQLREWRGVVQSGTTVEYERHPVDGKLVRFPKRISSNYAAGEKIRTTEGYMQRPSRQRRTITIDALKLNARLTEDAFAAPTIPANVRFTPLEGIELSHAPPELRERTELELRRIAESKVYVKKLLEPLDAMAGKPAPALPEAGWVGGARPELTGKSYVLAFWATSCGPCKNDIPQLRQMATDGVQIVGMHPGGTPDKEVADFIRKHNLGYPTLLGEGESNTIGGYPLALFPYYVLVDQQGTIAAHGHLQAVCEKLAALSEPPTQREGERKAE